MRRSRACGYAAISGLDCCNREVTHWGDLYPMLFRGLTQMGDLAGSGDSLASSLRCDPSGLTCSGGLPGDCIIVTIETASQTHCRRITIILQRKVSTLSPTAPCPIRIGFLCHGESMPQVARLSLENLVTLVCGVFVLVAAWLLGRLVWVLIEPQSVLPTVDPVPYSVSASELAATRPGAQCRHSGHAGPTRETL